MGFMLRALHTDHARHWERCIVAIALFSIFIVRDAGPGVRELLSSSRDIACSDAGRRWRATSDHGQVQVPSGYF
jgi:hypothetical protein